MRRALCLAVIVVAVFIIGVTLTMVTVLADQGQYATGLSTQDLASGNIHGLLLSKSFWSIYPMIPATPALLDIPTLLFVGIILLAVWTRLGIRRGVSSVGIAVVSLLLGAAPFLVGMWALHDNSSLAYAQKWLAMMVMGVLYCAATSVLLATLDFINIDVFKTLAKVPVPKLTLEQTAG